MDPLCMHCINLMVENIGKMKTHKKTLELPKRDIQFIYNHCRALSLIRKYTTNEKELYVVTCFATSLTLQRLQIEATFEEHVQKNLG